MSIDEYNGAGMIAMCGKNCVAIASDMRFGVQQQTIADDMHKIFQINDKLFLGFTGLATDMFTVKNTIVLRTKLYELQEERPIKPSVFANMVSGLLYEHRFGPFFIEPVICGLEDRTTVTTAPAAAGEKEEKKVEKEEKNVPFICATDVIGASCYTNDFLVSGTAKNNLYGVCEAMWKKDMDADQLFETISQCLLAGVDRDCLSGWGAIVHVITPDKIITKTLKSRKD